MKIIIADSGSTKTDWVLVDLSTGSKLLNFSTSGINPYYMGEEDIVVMIKEQWNDNIPFFAAEEIFFYGAGCSSRSRSQIVQLALKRIFPHAQVHVSHDLMAAARAYPGSRSRIACILGTGSNACLYEDGEIREKVFSLGYLFGDEGSGAHIGKKIAASYLKGEMPEYLAGKFEAGYANNKEEVLQNVYGRSLPNRYLADFAKFAGENQGHPFLQQIVKQSFRLFFQNYILSFSGALQHPVFFIGSVAYHFQSMLADVAGTFGYSSIQVARSPLQGLVSYHTHKGESPIEQ